LGGYGNGTALGCFYPDYSSVKHPDVPKN